MSITAILFVAGPILFTFGFCYFCCKAVVSERIEDIKLYDEYAGRGYMEDPP